MQNADDPAPPVSPSRLFPDIIRYCLSEGDAAPLTLDRQFMSVRFRAHQIVRLLEFSSTELSITLLSRSIARAFEINHSKVARAKFRGYEDRRGAGGITNLREKQNKN
jgi:hypothetical protein